MPNTNTLPEQVWHVAVKGMSGLEYRWGGALTVNIYQDGEAVDVFTMGGAESYGTFEDVLESVTRRESCLAGDHDTASDGEYCDYCGESINVPA